MTAILILGAAVWRDGPSPTLRRRTLHAAMLFHAGQGDLVIPCGGMGRFPPSEAEAMAAVLREAGVPEDAIRLEDTSTNTAENIRNAAALLGDARDVLIVSDAYHLLRARLIARREGLRAAVSAPPLKGARWWPQVRGWLREIPGVIAALLRIR